MFRHLNLGPVYYAYFNWGLKYNKFKKKAKISNFV